MTSPRPFQWGRSNASTSYAGERCLERGHGGRIRPVADADEERLLVEPDRVAAFGEGGVRELGCDGDVGGGERFRDGVGLVPPPLLPRPEEHCALASHEHGVVDVHRVRVARVVARHDDLRSCALEDGA